jgi:hypothetical protein
VRAWGKEGGEDKDKEEEEEEEEKEEEKGVLPKGRI